MNKEKEDIEIKRLIDEHVGMNLKELSIFISSALNKTISSKRVSRVKRGLAKPYGRPALINNQEKQNITKKLNEGMTTQQLKRMIKTKCAKSYKHLLLKKYSTTLTDYETEVTFSEITEQSSPHELPSPSHNELPSNSTTSTYKLKSFTGSTLNDSSTLKSRRKRKRNPKGLPVYANYRGEGVWYPGTISRVVTANKIDIRYDDGDDEVERGLPKRRIRFGNSILELGQEVAGNWLGKGDYFLGRITEVNKENVYDIKYNIKYHDGDTENNVSRRLIAEIGQQ